MIVMNTDQAHTLRNGLLLALLFCTLFTVVPVRAGATPGAATESYRYRQQTGRNEECFEWSLEHREEPLLQAIGPEQRHQTLMEPNMATRRWYLDHPENSTHVAVWREGDELLLQGQWRGEPLDKTLQIDDAPWFQALSVSLRPFLTGSEESTEFWTLRPDKLTAHKIRARKRGQETVLVGGEEVLAHRVEVGMTGPAALLGKGRYWFRACDLVLLRYQGPGGLPGTPATTILLDTGR